MPRVSFEEGKKSALDFSLSFQTDRDHRSPTNVDSIKERMWLYHPMEDKNRQTMLIDNALVSLPSQGIPESNEIP